MEQIAIVLIAPTVLGTVAIARKVTRGTHTSKRVAKVYFSIFLYICRTIFQEQLRKEKQQNTFLTNF